MSLPRSTFYDAPKTDVSDSTIIDAITAICDDFESYGYRRVGAALRHRGLVVTGKKVRRLGLEIELAHEIERIIPSRVLLFDVLDNYAKRKPPWHGNRLKL